MLNPYGQSKLLGSDFGKEKTPKISFRVPVKVRCKPHSNSDSFFHPDYTVGSGLAPDQLRIKLVDLGYLTTGRELAARPHPALKDQ